MRSNAAGLVQNTSPRRKPGPISRAWAIGPGFRRGDNLDWARSAGFSLIEVMVALAIFGLAAVALIRLQGVSLASAATLSDRQYAAIVARNHALEAMLSPKPPAADQGRERAGIREWAWRRQISPGPDPGTQLIIVEVIGDAGQVIAADKLLWSGR